MVQAVNVLGWLPSQFYEQSMRDVLILLEAQASQGGDE